LKANKKTGHKLAESLIPAAITAAIFVSFFVLLLTTTIQATTTGSSDSANLTVYDDTDPEGGGESRYSNLNLSFIANYTNSSGEHLNATQGNSECRVRFDYNSSYGLYSNMTFNSTSLMWQYNRSFNYKGTHQFQVNCTSDYGNVTINDSFVISNTAPSINLDDGGSYIDFDGNGLNDDYWQCIEDTFCIYNFSANVTEVDLNDVLTFGYMATSNTTLTNFTLNSSTGVLEINYTNDWDVSSGDKKIELTVVDTESSTQTGLLRVNVTAINDAPVFLNLGENRTLNRTQFDLILLASDEENDLNLTFNVSFLSCNHTSINPPTGPDNCTLFNFTYYNATATNLSFMPQDNQKGVYEINFSVMDDRNATRSHIYNWTLSWNDPPYFIYTCDNEISATEGTEFNCYINASDPDELYNLTFDVNYTWFYFNGTSSNSTTIDISGGNASAFVNFTPTDVAVGNWSVNVTVTDTGDFNTSVRSNSTTFNLYVFNVNDSITIVDMPNRSNEYSNPLFTSSSYSLPVNATDDDLLIQDSTVYSENLTFFVNNSNLLVGDYLKSGNRTDAMISLNASQLGSGNHTINISVHDSNNYSIKSDIFTLEILGNNAPSWITGTVTNYFIQEGDSFNLNLSQNVTDLDSGEHLNFSYVINTSQTSGEFDSFSLTSWGIISFTPVDEDIGYWNTTITVTDGKTPVSLEFNFTINNTPDAPTIEYLQIENGTNSTADQYYVQEDNYTKFYLFTLDDDRFIDQKNFYSEGLVLNLTIVGPNPSLFNFTQGAYEAGQDNRMQNNSFFTPVKTDVGDYNITINVSDASGLSDTLYINLTVFEVGHAPNMTEIGNQVVSILYENLYLDINATDLEDGSDGVGGNLTFNLSSLITGGEFLTINSSTGVLNFTFNESHAGRWEYTVIVNDSAGEEDSETFNITVYDYPVIILPNLTATFNFKENVTASMNFSANHTVQDNLTYSLSINGNLRNSSSGYGNATNFSIDLTPNFTEETACTGTVNLTLNVSNSKLSNITSWSLDINHTNYPLSLPGSISDQSGGTPVIMTLSDYFIDIDAEDSCINQSIGFNYTEIAGSASGGGITVTLTNWTNGTTPTAIFSVGSDGNANYTITAIEYNETNTSQAINNITSNNFSVSLTTTTTPQVITSSSCFPAGTKVSMADGSYREIEKIKVGDYVRSYDETTNKISRGEVRELEKPVRDHMCKIIFSDGSEIKLTNEHPIYTDNGWKSISPEETRKENHLLEVNKLKIGNRVLEQGLNYKTIREITCWDESIQTYNLKSIFPHNTFYAEKILVHNKGGSSTKIISLKILVPEPVSARQKDRLVIPLGIENDGTIDLNGILLDAVVAKDGVLRNDLVASFDTSFFEELDIGERENVTLVVDIDTTSTGLFEVTINATVEDPEYDDWAKFYIEIEEEKDVLERIIFTEEFIIGNPQCAELVDLIEEAKTLFSQGQPAEALEMAESSLEACKRAISQPARSRIYERIGDKFLSYAAIASLGALVLGFAYYYYKKIRLRMQLKGY